MDMTKDEIREILDRSEEKNRTEIKEMLRASIEGSFTRFENTLLKRDAEVTAKIGANERRIDGIDHSCKQAMDRTDKLFEKGDGFADDIQKLHDDIASLKADSKKCDRHERESTEQKKKIDRMGTKITWTQGFIACVGVIFIVVKAFI